MARRVEATLKVVIFSLVGLQRFAVPAGGVPLVLPLTLLCVGYLLAIGALEPVANRIVGYAVGVGGCLTAALLSAVLYTRLGSLSSLVFLVVLYLPFVFRFRSELRALYPRMLEFFNRLMVVAAAVGLAQWAAQVIGWVSQDPFAGLPARVLVSGYNTNYPVHYGSPLLKTNAVVFLEPSFFAQFLALAMLIQLLLGGNRWRLPLYGGALLTTVSGTGLVLLGVGLGSLAWRRGGAWAGRAVAAAVLVAAVVYVTPAGKLLATRAAETSVQDSSGSARFVEPYRQVAAGLARDEPTLLIGRGPGEVSRTGASFFNPLSRSANYGAIPKLAGEYGLPATLAFVGFFVAAVGVGTPSVTLTCASLVIYFLLSSSLLQPHTTYLCLLLTALFARAPRARPASVGRTRPEPAAAAGSARPQPFRRR